MSLTDQLQQLKELHASGAMNDDEFARAKARLLDETTLTCSSTDVEQQTRLWAMLLHLSQFAGHIVPLLGFIAPVVIWQIKKDELPGIDAHGKVVTNWIISLIVYAFVSVILVFVLIGIPMLIALGALAIIFPIIGGIKASNGEVWKYPLSITFFE